MASFLGPHHKGREIFPPFVAVQLATLLSGQARQRRWPPPQMGNGLVNRADSLPLRVHESEQRYCASSKPQSENGLPRGGVSSWVPRSPHGSNKGRGGPPPHIPRHAGRQGHANLTCRRAADIAISNEQAVNLIQYLRRGCACRGRSRKPSGPTSRS